MPSCESLTASRQCTKCGEIKPLTDFGKHARGKFGRRSICRACVSQRSREYHSTPRGQEVIRRSRINYVTSERGKQWRRDKAQRHRRQNPQKAKARAAVSNAIESGRLIRPDACSACGAVGMVEAHHWNGYAEENWLDVQWLCKSCHLQADGQISRTESLTSD